MFSQKGSSSFLFIVIFAMILTVIAMGFLYFEFEGIDKSGVQLSPDAKQLTEQEKNALLKKLRK